MKTKISQQQRALNILQKAFDNGFECDMELTLNETVLQAEEFIFDTLSPEIEDMASEFTNDKVLYYNDGYGYEYTSSGEIYSYEDYRNAQFKEDRKLNLTTVINSLGQFVQVYIIVDEL